MISGWAPKRASTGTCRVSAVQNASIVWMRKRWAISAEFGRRSSTRLRISAAAFLVKVMARTSSGFLTTSSSFRKRRTSSSVFPEPAGAWTMKERFTSSAVSRAAALGFLLPAAQQRLPTVFRLRHLRQRLVVARETYEAHVARAEPGEHHRRYLLLRRHRVERELRLVGPLALPALGGDVAATGLVVDDGVAAALEAVHAVDARVECHPAEDDRPLLLGGDDRERRPLLLDLLEPLVPKAREALALELGEAASDRHLLHRRGGGALERRQA